MKKMRKMPLIIALALSLWMLIWPLLVGRLGVLWIGLELALTIAMTVGLMLWFNDRDTVLIGNKGHDNDTLDEDELGEAFEEDESSLDTALGELPDAPVPLDTDDTTGLVYLHKQAITTDDIKPKSLLDYVFEGFYLLCFAGIVLWRVMRVVAEAGAPAIAAHGVYLLDGVVAGILGVGLMVYLKLRQRQGSHAGDATVGQVFTAWAYTLLAMGVLIPVEVMLGLQLGGVHLWMVLVLSLYLPIAMSLNLIVAFVKPNLHDELRYVLFPPRRVFRRSTVGQEVVGSLAGLHFSPKSLYTLRYALHLLPVLVLGLGVVLLLSTSFVVVQPYQQGAIYRLGKLAPDRIVSGGLHVVWPFPIDRVVLMDVSRVNSREVGFSSQDSFDNIWTQVHGGDEHLLLLGGGAELVAVNMVLTYTLTDLYAYLTNHSEPTELLMARAYELLLERTHHTTLEDFLRTDRSSLAGELLDDINTFAQSAGLGVSVSSVLIEGIHPPVEVAHVYQRVISADLERNAIVTQAHAQAEQRLTQAEQLGQTAILEAQARQTSRVAAAQQELAHFSASAAANAHHEASFRLSRYLAAFEQVVSTHRVHVFADTLAEQMSQFVLGRAISTEIRSQDNHDHDEDN